MLEMHCLHSYMAILNDTFARKPMSRAGLKLAALDLNLLVVFDAIMQERNVTRAGERLGLSQPAMSHALTRLRHMLKDDLFIRTPKGMVPTSRAEQLSIPIRQALEGLQHSLEPHEFDPSHATRAFRIAVDNYAAAVFVGALAARLSKMAPGITADFRPGGTLNIADLLDRGELDLAIGPFREQGERFSRQLLLKDHFVAVLRKSHPAAAPVLTMEKFAELTHLEISSIHHPADFFDEALSERKLRRRVALRAPFIAAVRILATSDMVCVFPRRIAEEVVRYRPLVICDLAHQSPVIETAMIWPRWLNRQPAHLWLRDTAFKVVEGLR